MSDPEIRFATDDPPPADAERMKALAAAIINQQRAGFGPYADIRESKCPACEASGFNTGWGYWAFTCGAEIISDGTPAEPCGATKPPIDDSKGEG